ncbi:MAG TPA: Asp-tRNA(Asn)/Glu-tRNA(Gln) amidotransferase subunit GatA [Candidatus Acidoferrales bacterium]|nr:Asp-tRNA(Asn)/Glu-tRNA(Gln) amidotransferase subunit GatA [Candidatus Acidoferrales bacterium]
MNKTPLTIDAARQAVAERNTTARELAETFYSRIAERDGEIGAFLSLSKDRAFAQAERIDKLAQAGDPLPPLAGVPIGIKDALMTRGLVTTAGSKILQNFVAPYDATSVARLEAAGAVILGKLNCDEFAMGSSNENSAYKPVRNPRDTTRVPGGSSGGSAAAVAADFAVATLGTDTGGSIRQPAAFCGVVGLLPTYGRVSRYGLIAFASSLDHVGPLTHNVRDAATLLGILAGRDVMDSTSADVTVADYTAALSRDVRGLRIGLAEEYMGEGVAPEIAQSVEHTLDQLRAAGCEVVRVSLPHTKYAIPTYYLVATAEASANLARFDGVRYGHRSKRSATLNDMYRNTRDEGFGTEVKRRIMLGTYALSAGYYDAYYLKAQKVRTLLARDFQQAFTQVDAIITPTTPTPAFKLGEKSNDPVAMYLSDIFTVTANLAGIPGISVPCGTTASGLPIGVQILGRHFDEETVLRIAQAVENVQK